MPKRPTRPCRKKGCNNLTRDKKGFCEDHSQERTGWKAWNAKKGNRHQRGYGNDWYKLRDAIMLRDQGLCQNCLKEGRYVAASEVDHTVPKSQGGTDIPSNLQAICSDCHAAKTAKESRGGGR